MSNCSGLTSTLLADAWSALDGEAARLDLVNVTGDVGGLLPSNLPALPAMLAAVACSTLAASVLDAARRGRAPAPISLDAEHVALAARSERYARARDSGGGDLFAPLSRLWRTADGWLRLHANYRWHRERALGVLDCGNSPSAVAAAVINWRGEDLEDALASAGALGYAVRNAEQWQIHPQGRAVVAMPLLDSIVGTGTGRPVGTGRAAAARRVLDLTRVIAGPVATRTLAAWGADVLRIDSPHLPEIPAQALDMLPGKRSTLLDFADASDRAVLQSLLAEADVVVQGYRPGALARYGLAAAELAERHPHLTVVTLSAWGADGPWSQQRGFDSLVQCAAGIAIEEGADGEPGVLPAQVLDHATGYLAAAAVLLALADVEVGKPPRAVRLSLAQTARWLMSRRAGGEADRRSPRELVPERSLVSLPGASQSVTVIAPPGRAGDLRPSWISTTVFGSDPPRFARA